MTQSDRIVLTFCTPEITFEVDRNKQTNKEISKQS